MLPISSTHETLPEPTASMITVLITTLLAALAGQP